MDAITALQYLYQEHRVIAAAFQRGSSLAIAIMTALEEKRDPAVFVTLAEQWKACQK
jgi:hypothetical protein